MRLDLEHVSASYGQAVALRDVSLSVPSGSVVALLGPNGAGKTTLLSVASGLLAPRAGRVVLDRRDVTRLGPDTLARHGLCHITEGRSIFPGLTVAENLRIFSSAGLEKEGVDRAVVAFPRLGRLLHRIAGTMSGGEQQMLATARAYARGARVVLLDEVSMGLAPIIVDEIFNSIPQLTADGASLLLVEQYVSRALSIADYVHVLVRGEIVFAGEPTELAGNVIFAHYLRRDVAEVPLGRS